VKSCEDKKYTALAYRSLALKRVTGHDTNLFEIKRPADPQLSEGQKLYMNKMIERIEREAGVSGLLNILAEELSPTDLQSLLLEVYRIRSGRLQPPAVLSDFASSRFVQPSDVSPLALLRWEQVAFTHLPPGFQPVALSPVCPLGTNSVVAPVDQNWTVATARNTEVVSDSTNVLGLECALRRRELLKVNPKSSDPVHLAASHRLLRAQRYTGSKSVVHFSSFALCSAGRDQGNLQFEFAALRLHISFYLSSLRAFLGQSVSLRLSVTDLKSNAYTGRIQTQLFTAIRSEFAGIECVFDEQRTSGRGYYFNICFHIYARAASGQEFELVDGGDVDWTQKLLSNAKERLVTSGIGSERLCTEFGAEVVARRGFL
jgi:hypothetical protein